MSLHDNMIRSGHTIFKWRSYIPLLIIIPLLLALRESAQLEEVFGENEEDLWVLASFLLSLSGIAIRCFTVGFVPGGTSGRNTQSQRATHLNTTGMYSVILGVMMSMMVWWLVLIGALGFFIYMERIIMAEEAFLEQTYGAEYNEWRAKTPVIIPNLRLWRAPEMSFSWKTVLKREYNGLLSMATAFFVIEVVKDLFIEKEPFALWLREDIAWPVLYTAILILCLTLRFFKKHTQLLKVDGR
jgi:protein-S-isoprenylcysteine O-methyltransferase Ste14